MKWGDIYENDEEDVKQPNEHMKTVSEVITNEKGQKVKVTRTIKVVAKRSKVNKNIASRRKWAKFGACKGAPAGPEDNITYFSHETISFDFKPRKREAVEENESVLDKLKGTNSIVICRECGQPGHWTQKCPNKGKNMSNLSGDAAQPKTTADAKQADNKGGKYIPPSQRGDRKWSTASTRDDSVTLRVTNLPDDTQQSDLEELFRPFGHTTRIYLGQNRGFAYVSYGRKDDAEKALEKLNGYGFGNLILHVEWGKKREEGEKR